MEFNLFSVFRALLSDLGVDKKTSLYIQKRLLNEGSYVVTSLLPRFSKHVLSCLEKGIWTDFGSEVRTRRGLPVIFQGYLLELFTYCPSTGLFLSKGASADPVSLSVIRQACEYCYKLALPFTAEQLDQAAEKFASTDFSVPTVGDYDTSFVDTMRRNLETYYPSVKAISYNAMALAARPGPGTFSSCSKLFWKRRYQQPSIVPRYRDFGFGLRLNKRSPFPSLESRDPDYSEVLFVPKDSRGPRTISREPYSSLLFQMGFFSQMIDALERDTKNRVNFCDQNQNKHLAMVASVSRSMCTLDLQDASDRVSYAIVSHLFRHLPIGGWIEKFRTRKAKLPNGTILPLRKLSGMGSGFTFPTMALVIHLAICTHLSKVLNRPYRQVMKLVYVYGDDILVPNALFDHATSALHKVGLMVNSSKSYFRGYFRESCGGDYYYGNDVTPTRLTLKGCRPVARGLSITHEGSCWEASSHFLLNLERHCRELVKSQLFETANYFYSIVESRLGVLPLVSGESPVIGRWSDSIPDYPTDNSGNYQKVECWVAKPRSGLVLDMCPYQYMRTKLNKVAEHAWEHLLFPAGSPSIFGTVSVPRKISLVRRKVSGLALT